MASLTSLTVNDTGFLRLPNGTGAQRSSPSTGMTRYNSSRQELEVYNGSRWVSMINPPPSIVTNGLVLHMNAGMPESYSGTGTTWNDISSNNISFTLNNSITYSNSNQGSFSFNGSNNFASAANSTALDTQTPTVEVWVKTNNTNQNGFWFEKGFVNTQYSLFQEGTTIQWRQYMSSGQGLVNLTTTTATYMNTSVWYQVVGTYTSGSRILYINGTQVNSDTQAGTIATNTSGLYIGAYGTGTGYFYNGNLAIVRVYNRVLSSLEVQQNFFANRYTFNIQTN